MLYKVTVKSVLDFALPVYYHTLKVCEKQRLEQLQYKCAKLTCGALHFTSQIKLNNELGLETIATRADFLSLNTFHKILVGRSRPLVRSCMPTPTPYSEHNTRHRKLFVPYKSNLLNFQILSSLSWSKSMKIYQFHVALKVTLIYSKKNFAAIWSLNDTNFYQGEVNVPTMFLSFPPGVTLSLFPWLLPLHRWEEVTIRYFWALHTKFYIF